MNRKKQRNTILKKRLKKAKAKLAPKSKSTYISKAKRAAAEQEENLKVESADSVNASI
jgi:Protein of unknown function (DUF2986)